MKKKIVIAIITIASVVLIGYGAYILGFNKGSTTPEVMTQEILEEAVGSDLVDPKNDPDYNDLGTKEFDQDQNRERNDNDSLKVEKCIKNICLKDVEIYKYNDLNMVLVKGKLINKGKTINNKFININYISDNNTITKGYYINKIGKNIEIDFEAQYNEMDIFNAKEISINNPSSTELEKYQDNLEDGV